MTDKLNQIDLSKLLGFNLVSDRVSGEIDFKDDVVGATCGAKCGVEAPAIKEDDAASASAKRDPAGC